VQSGNEGKGSMGVKIRLLTGVTAYRHQQQHAGFNGQTLRKASAFQGFRQIFCLRALELYCMMRMWRALMSSAVGEHFRWTLRF